MRRYDNSVNRVERCIADVYKHSYRGKNHCAESQIAHKFACETVFFRPPVKARTDFKPAVNRNVNEIPQKQRGNAVKNVSNGVRSL